MRWRLDGPFASLMEKIMSKTKDTSNLEHRELTDTELNAGTGGATPKLYEVACKGTHHPDVIETWGGIDRSLGLTAMMGASTGGSGGV
jgi:hypothetical protein